MEDLAHLSDAAIGADGNIRSYGGGWLFLPNEVLATILREPRYMQNLPVFLQAKQELARYGIDYLVVLVPGNSVIYPDALNPAHPVSVDGLPYRVDLHRLALFEEFKNAGVDYIDLTPAYIRARLGKDEDARLKANTHWSCIGRVIAAQAVAEWIRNRPWASAIKPLPGKLSAVWRQEETSAVEPSMAEYLKANNLNAEDLAQSLYTRTVIGWKESGGDAVIQVTGDSHTISASDENESFAAQLAFELQADVSNVGAYGNWGFGALAIEARTWPADFMKRKVVVHIVSSRSYALFEQKYQPIFPSSIDLDKLKAMPASAELSHPISVEARCVGLSSRRNPEQLKPYDSSLTCALFEVKSVLSGDYPAEKIAVASWSILANHETTWSQLMVTGAVYRFELDPIAAHQYLKKVAKDFDVLQDEMDAGIYWCKTFCETGITNPADKSIFVISTDPHAIERAAEYRSRRR